MLARTLPGPFHTHGNTCEEVHGACLDRACDLRTSTSLRGRGDGDAGTEQQTLRKQSHKGKLTTVSWPRG